MAERAITEREGREPGIVFLHGAGANRHMWLPQFDRVEGSWRLLAPDLRGHGERRDESTWSFERSVDDVLEILAGFDAPPTVVGLSLGGYVAIGAAARNPDRVGGLVLSGATADYRGIGGFTTRLFGTILPLFARGIGKKNEEQLRRVGGDRVAEAMIAGGLSVGSAAAALRQMPGRDYAAMLAAYRGPVLVLNGERDRPNRGGEERVVQLAPGVRFAVVEDAGHACNLTKPDRFSDAVVAFHEHRVSTRSGRPDDA